MIKLINGNCEEVLSELGNIVNYAYERLGTTDITAYAALNDEKNLNLILRANNQCIYLVNDGEKLISYYFTMNDENELDCYLTNDYEVYVREDSLVFVDRENANQLSVNLIKRETSDPEGFDGFVSYVQYNTDSDLHVEMQIPHMFRTVNNMPHIYTYNLNKIESIFIDKKFSKKKPMKFGIPINKEYFTRFELDFDTIGYSEQKYKDILLKGSFDDGRSVVKYYRIKLIDLDGNYVTFFPLGIDYTEEEILNRVAGYGFSKTVPDSIIEIYNGNDSIFEEIKEICSQIKQVEDKKVVDYKLIMQIIPDNKE